MNNPAQVTFDVEDIIELPTDIHTLTRNRPYGLEGIFGTSLLYYAAGRANKRPDYIKVGKMLLDDVADHIMELGRADFLNGIPGIGWGVEWLAQNNFLNVNTDQILEDIDDMLYKSVVFSQTEDFSIRFGTLGLLMYFVQRFRSTNTSPDRMRKLAIQECIVILTDELSDKIEKLGSDGTIPDKNYIDIGNAVMFWATITDLNINTPTVEKGLYYTVDKIQESTKKLLQSYSVESNIDQLLYMVSSLNVASSLYQHIPWQQESSKMLNHIASLKRIESRTSLSIVNNFLLTIGAHNSRNHPFPPLNFSSVADLQFQAPYYKNYLIKCIKYVQSVEQLIRII